MGLKSKISIISGILIITGVALMMGIPFIDSSNSVQKIAYGNIQKLDEPENKMLDLISQEKAELSSKIGGKINVP